jgi:uncharacterized RDD family membrane protein YckC
MTYGTPPTGNAGTPEGYGQQPEGYGSPPPAWPGGYAPPPGAYSQQPEGYGSPPPAWPGGYAPPPGAYGQPAPAYGGPPGGYVSPAAAYANWPQRFGGYLMDTIPVMLLWFIGQLTAALTHSFVIYFLFLFAVIAIVGYNRWYEAGKTGQSWGKKALGLKLISERTGQPIGVFQAFVRDICHCVDCLFCFMGFLFPLWDAKRQTLADKIMRTVVIPSN